MVAVNCFDGAPVYTVEEVRAALDLDDHIPVLLGDARNRQSCKNTLLTLVQHLIERASASATGMSTRVPLSGT